MVYYNEGKQKVRPASQNTYLILYLKFQVTPNPGEQGQNIYTRFRFCISLLMLRENAKGFFLKQSLRLERIKKISADL